MDADRGLPARLAELGEYFALPEPTGSGWLAFPRLLEDQVLGELVARTRSAIAASAQCADSVISPRLAASSLHLGIAARLLSPGIGAAVAFSALPALTTTSVRVHITDTHTPRFAMTGVAWSEVADTTAAAGALGRSVLVVLTELGRALHALVGLSPQVSRGNLISAANGAVTVMALTRPQLRTPGRTLIRELLEIEPLCGTGHFEGDQLIRRSCCLFYQVPGAGLCGDCVLADATSVQRRAH